MRFPGGIGPLALICLLVAAMLFWLNQIPAMIFDFVFVASLSVSLLGSLPRLGAPAMPTCMAAFVLGVGGAAVIMGIPDAAVVPYLAIALAYAQLSYVFAHGLMRGRQPILAQLIRLMALKSDGAPEFWHFVRGQCQLWAVLGGLMMAVSIIAMLSPDLRALAGTALTMGVFGQLAVFILSHLYAGRRYGRPETWTATLKAMFHPAIWSKLEL